MADVFERLKAALADRYTIERELGAGGMATVYLAEDLKHHRKVAVKVLRPELAAALGPERFLQEIEIAAGLHHPHILPLYESGESDGYLFYVMPYEEGQSLRAKLAREGELPVTEAVRIIREVVDALAHAHEHGVVHRDIKPDNVLLSGRHALVTDFGVAKAVSEATGRQKLTTEGIALGTPTYMAPEQAAADPHIDHRADIYAVGAVAYELLTGRPPFTGTTPQEILAAHVTQAPEPLTKFRESVPPALEQLVLKCLAKKAADRWQSAEELLPQLEALATPSGGMTPIKTTTVGGVQVKRAKGPVGLSVVVGALVVLAVGWWMVAGRGETGTEPPHGPISIATLVFDTRGLVDEDWYLGEGIAEDISTQLAKIRGFEVKAHASARQLSPDELSFREIAERLGAQFLIHGSLRRQGDSVRITVQLIDPETEGTRWADDYTHAFTASNMFAVTRDVAERTASGLRVAMSAGEADRLEVVATENTEAYLLYVQGRFFWNQRGEGLLRGLEYFQHAVAVDSLYAPAYAGLADAYSLIGFFGMRRPSEVMPLAKAAALRALALDSNLAEAHTALGWVNMVYDWDMAAAETHYRRAVELNPSYGLGHERLAEYLWEIQYRDDEASAVARRAVELGPLSANALTILATVLGGAGEYDEATAIYRRAIDLAPSFVTSHTVLALLLGAQARYSEALEVLDTAVAVVGPHPQLLVAYGFMLTATGDTAGAVALYDELIRRRDGEYISSMDLAGLGVLIGRNDEAWEWFEMAFEERDPVLPSYLRRYEEEAPPDLIDDPRWNALRRRLGMR